MAFIVLGPKGPRDPRCEEVAKAARRQFEEAGWTVRNLRPRPIGPRPATGSRPALLMEPADAHSIYVEAHRSCVAVIQVAATEVLKDPASRPTPRNTMPLGRFVRYKTCFVVASPEEAISDLVSVAERWIESSGCSGDHDPRCLPLHVFSPDRDWPDLGTDALQFENHHGKAGRRRDSESREWPRDLASHGSPVDVVAGHDMQRGFHWDVQALRNTTFLSNAREVWELRPHGHLNVYPSSHIREGKSSRRKYEASRPSEVLEEPGSAGRAERPRGRRPGAGGRARRR